MTSFELVLFGGFQARAAGQVIDVPGRKERALLAFLALPPGERRSRHRLAGLLWGDRGEKQAGDSLRQAVLRLRKAFDPVQPLPLLTDRGSVTLDRAMVVVDVQDFEQLIAEGTPQAVARAIALYCGDLLDGLDIGDPAFEEWLLVERQRLRDLVREAMAALLERHLSGGERDQAGAVARRLLTLDPLREAAHRALMKIYAEQGQAALALKQYQLCNDALQTELGVRPEAETERLYQSIKGHRAASRQLPGQAPAAAAPAESGPAPFLGSATPNMDFAGKPALAVLPFVNMSGDPQQAYFSDGITEDIITELSRFRELLVIARNSSFQYRDKANDLGRIGRELGVQYVVEGSIRTAGSRVRITVGVVDIAAGSQLWTEHYDRDLQDMFAVQDEVAQAVAATVEGRVAASGAQRSRRKPTHDLAAYDFFLQGRECLERYDPDAAVPLLRRAVELDPGFARAYAWLSSATLMIYNANLRPEMLQEGLALARTAMSLDDADAWSHRAIGFAYALSREFDRAGLHLRRAVELNPMDVRITSMRALWLVYTGRADDALHSLDGDMRRDPFPPRYFWAIRGVALFQTRQYEETIQAFNRVANFRLWNYLYLASAHAHLGLMDQARAFVGDALRIRPSLRLGEVGIIETFKDPTDLAPLVEGLRSAGLPD